MSFIVDVDKIHEPRGGLNTPHPGFWAAINQNMAALGTWVEDSDVTWNGSSSNPTLGNGTLGSHYVLRGEWLDQQLELVLGSTTVVTATGDWSWPLPAGVEFAETGVVVGCGQAKGGSGPQYMPLVVRSKTASSFEVYPVDDASADDTPMGTNMGGTDLPDASGDHILVSLSCRVKPFDPTEIAWKAMWATVGAEFAALDTRYGDTVSTWPDEIASADLTATGAAAYQTPDGLDNLPGIDVDGPYLTGTLAPSYASGVTFVVVASVDDVASDQAILHTGQNPPVNSIEITSGGKWRLYANGTVRDSTADATTGPHLFVAFYDGSTGNDTLDVDGTRVVDANAGSSQMAQIRLGNNENADRPFDGHISFVGVYEGDLRSSMTKMHRWATRFGVSF